MTLDLESADSLLAAAGAATAELTRSRPDYRSVVGWLSRHAAALEHAVFPAARRELSGPDLAAQVELTRRLEHVLLQLHQELHGDGRGAGVDINVVGQRLGEVLAAHVTGVRTLLVQLMGLLSDDEWSALLTQHWIALRNAPSRPHPHIPRGRIGERIAFHVFGAVDHVLDTLDSRVVPPLPAPRSPAIGAPNQVPAAA